MRGAARVFGLILLIGIVVRVEIGARQKAELAAEGGWVKLPAAGEMSAMAFADVNNTTMYDVYLTSATTDVAGKVELRETGPDGVTKPDALKSLTVPAFGWLSLKPKGVYLLLTDLKRPLKEGETISLTLGTDGGIKLEVEAVVRKE